MAMLNFEDRLTPAARETLNEIVSDYRKEVLVTAAANASSITGDVREIAVHDIVRAIRESSDPFKIRARSMFDRLLLAYTVFGVGTVMFSLALYGFQNISKNIAFSDRLPLLAALTGATIAMLSVMLLVLKRIRPTGKVWHSYDLAPVESLGSYLVTWRDIEVALRSLASSTLGETVAQEPISFLVKRLEKQKTLSKDVADNLQKLLETRNRLAHGTSSPDQADVTTNLREARRVLDEIQNKSRDADVLQN